MGTPPTPAVEELSASECWALLREIPIGRIALKSDDGIEIFPMNFVVDSGTILFRTASETKLNLIGEGAPCTFEADQVEVAERLAWSVVIKGAVRPVRGQDAIFATFDLEVSTWQAGPKPTYVRLTPDSISGRRFPVTTD